MADARAQNWHRDFAAAHGFTINADLENIILNGLEKKNEKFGDFFCPCKIDNCPENVCPCVELRETGHCHCRLFQKVEAK